jgi:elongation factor Ts
MAEITAQLVKELREKTGAGMMDCKKALSETAGDMVKAEEWLRVKGITKAGSKGGRTAAEGVVGSYIHMGGKIGVLVEVNCETDFVARNEDFQALVKDIAMHIAAANPLYVRREEIPAASVEREKDVERGKLKEEGKVPEKMWDKVLEGKINKWFQDVCLLDQAFVKDPDKTVDQLVKEKVGKIGENIQVRRFARFQVGEGIEKKKEDLAAAVAEQIASAKQ